MVVLLKICGRSAAIEADKQRAAWTYKHVYIVDLVVLDVVILFRYVSGWILRKIVRDLSQAKKEILILW